MKSFIFGKEVRAELLRPPRGKKKDRPNLFSLVAVTADLQKMTGGELLHLKNACLARYANNLDRKFKEPKSEKSLQKHYEHDTFNLFVSNKQGDGGRIVKVHFRSIVEFNGKEVIW